MTLCNMAIEFGAKVGMIAPDEITLSILRERNLHLKEKNFKSIVSIGRV